MTDSTQQTNRFTSFPQMTAFIRQFIIEQADYGVDYTNERGVVPRYETRDGLKCSIGCILDSRQLLGCGNDLAIDRAPEWVYSSLISETHLNNIIFGHGAAWGFDQTMMESFDRNELIANVLRTLQTIHDICATRAVPLTGEMSFDTLMRKTEDYMRSHPAKFYESSLGHWGDRGIHSEFYSICEHVGCPEIAQFVREREMNERCH